MRPTFITNADVHTAWHGTKLYSVQSIMINGRIMETYGSQGIKGVWCFGKNCEKAGGYCLPIDVFHDGTIWTCMFELEVDRTPTGYKQAYSDQWIQNKITVHDKEGNKTEREESRIKHQKSSPKQIKLRDCFRGHTLITSVRFGGF